MRRPRLAVLTALVVALATAAPANAAEQTVELRLGRRYVTRGDQHLRLDAYLPADGRIHPGVILLHGGSWSGGHRSDLARVAQRFAERGFAAFTIDYRLAPRFPYPAALRDAQAAVAWVRANARAYRVDPEQLASFGVSAGGHLAAMLAVVGEGATDAGSRVRAAVSWSGPMDLRALAEDARAGVERVVRRFVGCATGTCAALLREASPVAHVDPSDGAILVANSSREVVPFAQAEAMEAAAGDHAVPHQLVEAPGTTHGNLGGLPDARSLETVWEASVSFLRAWLPVERAVPAAIASGGSSAGPLAVVAGLLALLAIVTALSEAPRWGRRLLSSRGDSGHAWLDGAAIELVDSLSRAGADRRGIGSAVATGYRSG